MRKLFALVAASCMVVSACAGDGSTSGSEDAPSSTSIADASSSSATTTRVGDSEIVDPALLADACAMFSGDSIDDMVRSAYDAEGLLSSAASVPTAFERYDSYETSYEMSCTWLAQTGRAIVTLQTPSVIGEYEWCRSMDATLFRDHPAMPAGVTVAGVDAHATWVPYWRLVAEMKITDEPGLWCFEFETVGLRHDEIEAVGLRVAGAMIERVAKNIGDDVAVSAASETVAPGYDAQPFTGTTSCVMTHVSSVVTDDGDREIREHFSCALDSSDQRITGTQELDTVTVVPDAGAPMPPALLWWAEDDVISNTGGSWRRIEGYGVVDMVGVHPMARGVTPFNYGTVRYVGEGEYADLTMTILVAATNESGAFAGWIEPK